MRTAKIIRPFKTAASRTPSVRARKPDTPKSLLTMFMLETADSIVLLNSDYMVVSNNESALEVHLATHKDLFGNDYRMLFAATARPLIARVLAELSENKHWTGELQARRMDGRLFPANVTVKSTPLEGCPHYLMVIRDLSKGEHSNQHLRQESAQQREMFSTISNLMQAFEKEKKGLERGIYRRIERLLLPALENVKKEPERAIRNGYLEVLKSQLIGLTQGFEEELDGRFLSLTRTEMRVCRLIQAGYASKEVADKMHIAFETVQVHRRNIRRKLGLQGRKINLHAFLADKILFRESRP